MTARPTPRRLLVALAIACLAGPSLAGPIRSDLAGATLFDGAPAGLGFSANVFGRTFDAVTVGADGTLSFGAGGPVIAAFLADPGLDYSGKVTYATGLVDGNPAFAATWAGVGPASRPGKTNDFQAVLIGRADTGTGNFDLELNYGPILWDTAALDGSGSTGRVGVSPGAGLPGGFELPGSGAPGALTDGGPNALSAGGRNSDVMGRYRFESRDGRFDVGDIVPPVGTSIPPAWPLPPDPLPPAGVPEPGTLLLAGLGGLATLGLRRFRGSRAES